ncbi:26S proteasome non-ATPase regulatory subunit 4-like [Paramacrobiotus metropolitanus]|uniref:26S proteasome non-ATPase regulatory subunit 4-like n=1 Tax=Paramacrobiotus metropolitanus TaxID=2943436 RepID=UPI00244631EC|nr:26S proteasome non-ATPase regulatory subunit 4-like [Paramacrobiotus metropolitanus]
MVLESTIVCVDNSEYMRNGDYLPTRLHAQNEAVEAVCKSKTRSNPENNVGLVTFSNGRVIVTLTTDKDKLLANLQQVTPQGLLDFHTGIRVAHLALKHRQGRNHKMRIVAFVGSPVAEDEKELVRLAKRLKKEKVNVDVVAFGQEGDNLEKLNQFVNTLNGKDGTGSHIVVIPPGPQLVEALLTSPVILGEDGAGGGPMPGGFDGFGIDPNDDPELALALRVSMEEQRARQEQEQRAQGEAQGGPAAAAPGATSAGQAQEMEASVFANVAQEAGAAAVPAPGPAAGGQDVNFHAMTEEEQLAYAMQMSLHELDEHRKDEAMDTDDAEEKRPPPAQ